MHGAAVRVDIQLQCAFKLQFPTGNSDLRVQMERNFNTVWVVLLVVGHTPPPSDLPDTSVQSAWRTEKDAAGQQFFRQTKDLAVPYFPLESNPCPAGQR